MGKPTREECADRIYKMANWHTETDMLYVASHYLRQDADLAARLETAEAACAIMRERAERCEAAEAERDALAAQVASCRKAFGEIAKGIEDLDLDEIARFAGVPVAHLTGETEEAGE